LASYADLGTTGDGEILRTSVAQTVSQLTFTYSHA